MAKCHVYNTSFLDILNHLFTHYYPQLRTLLHISHNFLLGAYSDDGSSALWAAGNGQPKPANHYTTTASTIKKIVQQANKKKTFFNCSCDSDEFFFFRRWKCFFFRWRNYFIWRYYWTFRWRNDINWTDDPSIFSLDIMSAMSITASVAVFKVAVISFF